MTELSRIKLESEMTKAETYDQWKQAALAHDDVTGMVQWKKLDQTHQYDHIEIRRRLDQLRDLRRKGDDHALLFSLNEGIHGNLAGMGSKKLYSRAKFGTKELVYDYIDEVINSIEYLAQLDERAMSYEERLEFFHRARDCYGCSALMMSGGANLGMFHLGVIKAMIEHDALPDVISGSSAGSVVAAIAGTRTDEELVDYLNSDSMHEVVQEESEWVNKVMEGPNAQIDVHDVETMIEQVIPDLTFEEAYEKTGRHINISIAPAELNQSARLLNAITSPNVYIRKAVLASCAVPGVFPTVTLYAKNVRGESQPYLPSRKWIDGSVASDLPARRLARLYGANYFIASQTNPMVLWMVRDAPVLEGIAGAAYQFSQAMTREWFKASRMLSTRLLRDFPRLNLFANMMYSVGIQEYTADVNIIPRNRSFDPAKLLSPVTEEELEAMILEGERATWPKLEMIRNCSRIAHQLDRIIWNFEHGARTSAQSGVGRARQGVAKKHAKAKSKRKAVAKKAKASKRTAKTKKAVKKAA
jgi:NTE family protein